MLAGTQEKEAAFLAACCAYFHGYRFQSENQPEDYEENYPEKIKTDADALKWAMDFKKKLVIKGIVLPDYMVEVLNKIENDGVTSCPASQNKCQR